MSYADNKVFRPGEAEQDEIARTIERAMARAARHTGITSLVADYADGTGPLTLPEVVGAIERYYGATGYDDHLNALAAKAPEVKP